MCGARAQEGFQDSQQQDGDNGALGAVNLFVDAWTKYDRNAANCIPISRFVTMMQDAPWPFGLQRPDGSPMTNGAIVHRLKQLNIPVYVVPLYKLRRTRATRAPSPKKPASPPPVIVPSPRGRAPSVGDVGIVQGSLRALRRGWFSIRLQTVRLMPKASALVIRPSPRSRVVSPMSECVGGRRVCFIPSVRVWEEVGGL